MLRPLQPLLDTLAASLPAATPDPLQYVRDSLCDPDCCLDRADETGFWLECGDGTRRVDIPGGLAETHYHHFASLLTDDEKTALAMGVLKNAMSPLTQPDWRIVQWLLRKRCDKQAVELPDLVQTRGFAALANELIEELLKYKKHAHRRNRIRLAVIETPSWDGRILSYGERTWTIHRHNGPVNQLLDELERTKWQHAVNLKHLTPSQVREAAKMLRTRTRPHIEWHAGNDGDFSWSLS